MEKIEFNTIIETPELYAGEVVGGLSGFGGDVFDIKSGDGVWTIYAQFDKEKLEEIERFLSDNTEGRGRMVCLDSSL